MGKGFSSASSFFFLTEMVCCFSGSCVMMFGNMKRWWGQKTQMVWVEGWDDCHFLNMQIATGMILWFKSFQSHGFRFRPSVWNLGQMSSTMPPPPRICKKPIIHVIACMCVYLSVFCFLYCVSLKMLSYVQWLCDFKSVWNMISFTCKNK